jgi:hypothetical protein
VAGVLSPSFFSCHRSPSGRNAKAKYKNVLAFSQNVMYFNKLFIRAILLQQFEIVEEEIRTFAQQLPW